MHVHIIEGRSRHYDELIKRYMRSYEVLRAEQLARGFLWCELFCQGGSLSYMLPRVPCAVLCRPAIPCVELYVALGSAVPFWGRAGLCWELCCAADLWGGALNCTVRCMSCGLLCVLLC